MVGSDIILTSGLSATFLSLGQRIEVIQSGICQERAGIFLSDVKPQSGVSRAVAVPIALAAGEWCFGRWKLGYFLLLFSFLS